MTTTDSSPSSSLLTKQGNAHCSEHGSEKALPPASPKIIKLNYLNNANKM